MRTHPDRWIAGLCLGSALAAGPAFAHEGAGLAGGLAAGLAHPLHGLDHLLAMVAVGLWGAFLGRPLVFALPVIFPLVMALGGVMGMAAVPVPPVEIGIALSVLVLGGAIAAAVRAPVWAAALLVAVFAIFHGYAHGQELPSAADPVGYSAGFVLATGLLHLAGVALGLIAARPGGVLALRGVGALIAAAGGYFIFEAAA
ncbi:HupE/UreJ family protein [Phenylobacterium sp.]|uniref:HupE/UreJ family protein n=1 Tax=Phenylobacterium sp. TaxID=1871053 RepID=UPI002E31D7D1|nr:HupE/UreJ family protein [Phenylobacterium sp.]HEX2560189.1 HupE/UreJ family protein [Phenylobacterium sp.]